MHENFVLAYPKRDSDFFIIDLAGTSECDGSYCICHDRIDVNVFLYIIAGTGTVRHDTREFTASAGDVVILHTRQYHYYFSDAVSPWRIIWFNLRGRLVDKLLEAYRLEDVVVVKNCNVLELFEGFHAIIRAVSNVKTIHNMCALKLHELIGAVSECYYHTEPVNTAAEQLKNFLDGHIDRKITLNQMAGEIDLSPAQAIHIFKQEYGVTPYAYFQNNKIEAARKLLLNTRFSVKEIAFRLGFCDEHYFSNIFKSHTGVSPQAYRNAARDGQEQ